MLNETPRTPGFLVAFCSLLGLVASSRGGPLMPPVGVVAPTPGPEPRTPVSSATTPGDADSVYRIAAPGSYYLTGNISGVANKHGIELASGGIVLDLNGFSITGSGIGSGNFDGVTHAFSTFYSGITIRNGAVTGWGRSGINLLTPSLTGCVIEGVHAALNSANGFAVPSDSALTRCTASRNALAGYSTLNGVTFDACTASDNGAGGFFTENGSIFRACDARSNAGDGFNAGIGCTFENCTANANDAQYGFDVSIACTFNGCVATQNTSNQSISAGFECQGGCVFTSCISNSNTSTNASPGPSTGAGFIIGTGSTITGCLASTNKGDGIRANNRSHITENKVIEAGFIGTGAAIRVTGDQCRVEGNHCSTSDVGFDIEGTGTFIIRNTSVNNTTDYTIGVNNFYGPIIDRTAAAGQAVNGPSAGGNLNTSDPNANFSR